MVKTIIWSNNAIRDLENIVNFIRHDSPAYALVVYNEIEN